MATVSATTLNQYTGTDSVGNQISIVAEDMSTACQVYNEQQEEDPVIMQRTKSGIKCVLPTVYVTFTTTVKDASGGNTAATAGCIATPSSFTVLGGTKQIFSAIPSEGWGFTKWTIDGVDVENSEPVMELTIPTNTTGLCNITAVFTAS